MESRNGAGDQMHDIRIESAQRLSIQVGERPGWLRGLFRVFVATARCADTVVRRTFTWRRVGRDHQGFMTGSARECSRVP